MDGIRPIRGRTARPPDIFNYRRLFLDAPIGMHRLDRAGKILDVNRAWAKMLGYQRRDVIGRPFTDFIPEAERGNAMVRFLARLDGKKVPERDGDRHYQKFDGSLFPVRTKDTIIKNQGRSEGVITSLEDITPLRKMEKHERKNALLISGVNVASNMIDGLSQIMAAIQGFAELLQMYMERDPEKSKKHAKNIISQIDDMNRLFTLVREYQGLLSLLENGARNEEFQTSDILLALTAARHRLLGEDQNRESAIEITPQGDIPPLRIHPKIKDALYYILKSSVWDMREADKRHVKVNVASDDGSVLISITDDRRRQEAVTIERLEEPPFGHGITFLYTEYLELSIALLCIKLHGGDLRMSSTTAKDEVSGKQVIAKTTFDITLRAAK